MPSSNNLLESVGKLFSTFCVVVIGFLSRGLAISTLWNWFVVPFNVPRLTVIWAVGLSITITLFTADVIKATRELRENKREWGEAMTDSLLASFGVYPIVIALGWIIHSLT